MDHATQRVKEYFTFIRKISILLGDIASHRNMRIWTAPPNSSEAISVINILKWRKAFIVSRLDCPFKLLQCLQYCCFSLFEKPANLICIFLRECQKMVIATKKSPVLGVVIEGVFASFLTEIAKTFLKRFKQHLIRRRLVSDLGAPIQTTQADGAGKKHVKQTGRTLPPLGIPSHRDIKGDERGRALFLIVPRWVQSASR